MPAWWVYQSRPEGMGKPHYNSQEISPLGNGVYFMVTIKKTPLHNRNSPIMDLIPKMEVAHAFEHIAHKKQILEWIQNEINA